MELEVAWSGAIERSAILAQQKPAPSVANTVIPRKANQRGREILAVMRLAPARGWTVALLSQAMPSMQSDSLRAGLRCLEHRGEVTSWEEPFPCRHGYRRIYRVRGEHQRDERDGR